MPIEITMPRLSDTMEEGTLVKWHVKPGDQVSSGDHLADVETDKATMELQAFDDGTVAKLCIDEGKTVPVGELIVLLAGEGESVEDAANVGERQARTEPEQAGPQKADTENEGSVTAQVGVQEQADASSSPQRISPLARRLATENNIDPATITGSGPEGRVIKRDVLAALRGEKPVSVKAAAAEPAAPTAKLEARTIELSNMRKTIARRLLESKTTIPHFNVSITVNVKPLMDLRSTLNSQLESQGIKLSVNDFAVRAAALACVRHPMVNSSWADGSIRLYGTVNMGVAVSLPPERGGGLIVPVIRDAHNLGLRAISETTRSLATKARETGLSQEEMSDGTFTLTNLGMYGIEQFAAIINPPQAAILAIGAAVSKPVVIDGELAVGWEMTVTLAADHRIIDGAIAADYLKTFKGLLEGPAALLV